MALANNLFEFTGSIGKVSAYKMRGSDKIILRTKGGPSKNQVKKSRKFDVTRRNNSEFGGRSLAASHIMRMMYPLKSLADYNIAGPLNSLLKRVQVLDTASAFGQRNVKVSLFPKLLEGFSLNRRTMFDGVVRAPLVYSIDRDARSARIEIPELVPGINLFIPDHAPLYGLTVSLGIVPDVYFTHYGYRPLTLDVQTGSSWKETAWFPVRKGSPPLVVELAQLPVTGETSSTLLLTIGLRLGTLVDMDKVEQVRYSGCAKVIGAV